MGHRLVCARNDKVDLTRFRCERLLVALEHLQIRHASIVRSGLEGESQPLDGPETPRNSGREEWIYERECVRQKRPPLPRRAREAMLNPGSRRDGHQRRGLGKRGFECRIPSEQCFPDRRRIRISMRVERRDASR